MAALVLGAVGGFMFGPIGFLGGSLLGNLLFPGKQEGPRLTNLKLQNSSYGQMIPIPYGVVRLSGQVVWQTDLKEHKHTSGGKGGPEVTTYSYTDSFAVKICKGPIAGILKIWANGEIIWDITGSTNVDNTKVPITIYVGNESALPDPTMEAVLGVGHVPAFRDDAAVVFTDWDLGHFGNTLPNLSFEVFASGGPIPWRVNTFDAVTVPGSTRGGNWCPSFDPTTSIITIGRYANSGGFNTPPAAYSQRQFLLDGTPTGTDIVDMVLPELDPAGFGMRGFVEITGGLLPITFAYSAGSGPGGAAGRGQFYVGGQPVGIPVGLTGAPFGANPARMVSSSHGGIYQDGYVYLYAQESGGPQGVARWPAPDGVPSGLFDKTVVLTPANGGSSSTFYLGSGDNGDVWLMVDSGIGGDPPELYQFDSELNIKYHWISSHFGGSAPFVPSAAPDGIRSAEKFIVYNGMICANTSEPSTPPQAFYDTVWRINPTSHVFSKDPAEAPEIDGTLLQPDPKTGGSSPLTRLRAGLVLGIDGIISLDPPQKPVTLASIERDVSKRTGLTTADIDVSGQEEIFVDGYLITTRTDARSDLAQLRSNYFVDVVERQGKAVFVNRGAQPALTIPDNDLAAQQKGGKPPPPLEVLRETQDLNLPVAVNVTYINAGAAYQNGTQQAIRQTVRSQSVADVQLAIVMTDLKGRQVANVLLYEAWIEREKFKVQLPRKYMYLEPTDVIMVRGYILRLGKKGNTTKGVIEFEAVASLPALYLAALTASPTSGAQQPSSSSSQPTNLVLLDLPLITDTDLQQGLYAAMAGTVDMTWRGATLYKSADGTTYDQIGASGATSVIGTVTDPLGNFDSGNIVDELNQMVVTVGPGGGTLASIDRASLLNGGNLASVGNEILQFRDAVLTAPSTYLLSGLLRGRRGTEFAISAHGPLERFVLLPVLDVVSPFSDLGQSRQYKAVSRGDSLSATSALGFINRGAALRPYAPVHLYGAPNASTGDVTLQATRRTRIGGIWADFTDVPVSEASELYVLQIWDSTFTLVARVVTGLTSPNFVYTAAMQTADFGATQQHIYWSIGQLGSYGLGTQKSAITPGIGASDNAPLSPVPPYNSPPPSGGGPGCSGTVIPVTRNWTGAQPRIFTGGGFGGDDVWLISFTTAAGPWANAFGQIVAAEWASQERTRIATFSREPCGAPVWPTNTIIGRSITLYFFMRDNPYPSIYPTLLPGVTYYLSIRNKDGMIGGMFSDFSSPA